MCRGRYWGVTRRERSGGGLGREQGKLSKSPSQAGNILRTISKGRSKADHKSGGLGPRDVFGETVGSPELARKRMFT